MQALKPVLRQTFKHLSQLIGSAPKQTVKTNRSQRACPQSVLLLYLYHFLYLRIVYLQVYKSVVYSVMITQQNYTIAQYLQSSADSKSHFASFKRTGQLQGLLVSFVFFILCMYLIYCLKQTRIILLYRFHNKPFKLLLLSKSFTYQDCFVLLYLHCSVHILLLGNY